MRTSTKLLDADDKARANDNYWTFLACALRTQYAKRPLLRATKNKQRELIDSVDVRVH